MNTVVLLGFLDCRLEVACKAFTQKVVSHGAVEQHGDVGVVLSEQSVLLLLDLLFNVVSSDDNVVGADLASCNFEALFVIGLRVLLDFFELV